jgi:hypothetical protein
MLNTKTLVEQQIERYKDLFLKNLCQTMKRGEIIRNTKKPPENVESYPKCIPRSFSHAFGFTDQRLFELLI